MKIEGEFNFLVIFLLSLEREFLFEIVRILKKCSIRDSRETSDFLFICPKTTGVNERLIRKFNYTNFHVNMWMVGGVQLFGSLNLMKIIRYILYKYSYIFVAHAVILTVKRSLKNERKADNKRKRKERTRESEKRSYKKER